MYSQKVSGVLASSCFFQGMILFGHRRQLLLKSCHHFFHRNYYIIDGGHPVWHLVVGMCIPFVINVAVGRLSASRRGRPHQTGRRLWRGPAPAPDGAGRLPARRRHDPPRRVPRALRGVFRLRPVLHAGRRGSGRGRAWLAVTRPSRASYSRGAAGNAAVLGLWLVTRTAGLPIGPNPGTPRPSARWTVCRACTKWSSPVVRRAGASVRAYLSDLFRNEICPATVACLAEVAARPPSYEVWAKRHRWILNVLWLHAPGLFA